MQIKKITLGEMVRCYCASHMTIGGEPYVLLASEEKDGPCYAYGGKDFSRRESVWEKAGGTMSIVEIPHRDGEFLAVQHFFPGFQSAEAKIVWGKRCGNGQWQVKDVLRLPYVHRFDILERGGVLYFLGSVLCGSKKDRNDWSDPGFVVVGVLPEDFSSGETIQVSPILTGLVKNHGYWHDESADIQRGFVTCESGIYVFTPPENPSGQWSIEHLLNRPISDVTVVDLDGCGVPELVTIEPFHGNQVCVYKKTLEGYKNVYAYDRPIDFAHALWGGTLLDAPAAVVGIRRMDCELFILRCADTASQRYETQIIESGVGTSNVDVVHLPEQDVLIAANHTKNEAALYLLTRD